MTTIPSLQPQSRVQVREPLLNLILHVRPGAKTDDVFIVEDVDIMYKSYINFYIQTDLTEAHRQAPTLPCNQILR